MKKLILLLAIFYTFPCGADDTQQYKLSGFSGFTEESSNEEMPIAKSAKASREEVRARGASRLINDMVKDIMFSKSGKNWRTSLYGKTVSQTTK